MPLTTNYSIVPSILPTFFCLYLKKAIAKIKFNKNYVSPDIKPMKKSGHLHFNSTIILQIECDFELITK